MQHFKRLNRKQLVEGLPKLKFEKDKMCEACQKGKQTKVSFKSKNVVTTERPLEMLQMDLFGPSRTMSLGGNLYALVIVDDFSRYTWTLFLAAKNDTFHAFKRVPTVCHSLITNHSTFPGQQRLLERSFSCFSLRLTSNNPCLLTKTRQENNTYLLTKTR